MHDELLEASRKLEEVSPDVSRVLLEKCPRSLSETPSVSRSSSEEGSQDPDVEARRDHDVEPMSIVYSNEDGATEPTTGIIYPAELNEFKFIGCGVRTKYYVFHAYTVGLYLGVDIKPEDSIGDLLLDPKHPKIFRLVMNRNVTSSQYMGAIYDVLTPLMRGQDMDK